MHHYSEHERGAERRVTAPPPQAVDPRHHGQSSDEPGIGHLGSGRPSAKPTIAATAGAPLSSLLLSKLVWLLGTSMVFFVAWVLGPRLVEHYQYAATKARIQAEYDVATVALKDAPLANISSAYQMVARRIRPSVVHIATVAQEDPNGNEWGINGRIPFFPPEGQGSGVIVTEDGYIMTNEHVIRDAAEIVVVLSDRRSYRAKLVGVDVPTDLAVIKIDAADLIPAEWGSSDSLEVGSMVWAVGSPFGLEQSITFGIISAKHRKTNDNPFQDLLQSDAAVNPGNSGGPLVNARGQVVGINTSIVGESYQGISFSVPSALAKPILDRILKYGEVERGFLGVYPALVTHDVAVDQGLPSLEGALIRHVERDSPADLGGLRVGDVITRWNGVAINNDILLFRHVGLTQVNSTAEVTFWRNGKEQTQYVHVAPKPRS